MFGVDFKRCLSLGSGAKPFQVLYFFLFGVVVCGLSEGRVEGKLNFSRCVDIFSVFFPPVGCEWKFGRVCCCLQAFFVAGSGVKLWRTNILACLCCCALARLRIFLIRPCGLRACRVICFVFVG